MEKRKKGLPNLLRFPLFLTLFPTYCNSDFLTLFPTYCNSDFLHTPGFSRFTPNLLQLQLEQILQSSVAFDFFSFCKSRRCVLRYHLSSNPLHPWNATPMSILTPAVKKQREKTQERQIKKKQEKTKKTRFPERERPLLLSLLPCSPYTPQNGKEALREALRSPILLRASLSSPLLVAAKGNHSNGEGGIPIFNQASDGLTLSSS